MPKVLLSSTRTRHVFDLEFDLVDGGKLNNRDFPEDEQIVAEITTADSDERDAYLYIENTGKKKSQASVIRSKHKACVRKHCVSIENAEKCGIMGVTDGKTLVAQDPRKEFNTMISQIYLVAMGLYTEDGEDDEEEK